MSYNPQNPNGQSTMANSAPVAIASNQSTIPVSNSPDTSSIYSGSTALTPNFVVINASNGTTTLVTNTSGGKKVRVISYVVVMSAAATISFNSSTAGAKTGTMSLAANSGISGAYAPTGHFETAVNESLQIVVTGSATAGGHLTYVLV